MIFIEIKSQTPHDFDCVIAETNRRTILKFMGLYDLSPQILYEKNGGVIGIEESVICVDSDLDCVLKITEAAYAEAFVECDYNIVFPPESFKTHTPRLNGTSTSMRIDLPSCIATIGEVSTLMVENKSIGVACELALRYAKAKYFKRINEYSNNRKI